MSTDRLLYQPVSFGGFLVKYSEPVVDLLIDHGLITFNETSQAFVPDLRSVAAQISYDTGAPLRCIIAFIAQELNPGDDLDETDEALRILSDGTFPETLPDAIIQYVDRLLGSGLLS